jgi:hypothetical protein
MHELSIEKILLFKESEAERKVRLDEYIESEGWGGKGPSQDDDRPREGKVGVG